jgi:hypothetical protein
LFNGYHQNHRFPSRFFATYFADKEGLTNLTGKEWTETARRFSAQAGCARMSAFDEKRLRKPDGA